MVKDPQNKIKVRRTVYITDNGGTPFIVHLPFSGNVSSRPGTAAYIHNRRAGSEDVEKIRSDPGFQDSYALWKSVKYIKAWVGLDPSESKKEKEKEGFFARLFGSSEVWWHGGNTMLFQISSRTFMHVGNCIYTFHIAPKDEVLSFVSIMGHSAVPYPYAVGRVNTYLFDSHGSVPPSFISNQLLRKGEDPYDQYYAMDSTKGQKAQGFKLLHKRD